MELPEPKREIDVLRLALKGLSGDLPKDWSWHVDEQPAAAGGLDALVVITAPGGEQATLAVQVKRLVATRDIAAMVAQLESSVARAGLARAVPLLVGRYLAPATRERLEQLGVSYADAAGNRMLMVGQPAVLVRRVEQDRDPWRGPGRPRGTLKGAPAARVVRWLVDHAPPYSALQIAQGSGTSTGGTYRVLRFLEQEGLVERDGRGRTLLVRWRQVLERGSRDFGFQHNEPVQSLLYPRGIEGLVDALRSEPDLRYVLTGSIAAQRYEAYAPPRFAMLYADDVNDVVRRLGLRPVDTGANVLMATDRDEVAFVGASEVEGVRCAAPSQIAVDLLSGPGRSPSEGEALLGWMENHERAWRS